MTTISKKEGDKKLTNQKESGEKWLYWLSWED
jgi:hypothetical protein